MAQNIAMAIVNKVEKYLLRRFGMGFQERCARFLLEDKAFKEKMLPLFLDSVRRVGLNDAAHAVIFSSGDAELIAQVEASLRKHESFFIVRSSREDSSRWTRFLEGGFRPSPEDEQEMSLKEYTIFHEKGLRLSEDAVKHFLTEEDEPESEALALKVIEYDIFPNKESYSHEIMSLIKAQPEYLEKWLSLEYSAKDLLQ
jgi:hypothetical protein